ncbi:MAG: Gfo/Idh/MocA family protein [Lacipirellulaceae bacterium]
MRVAIVRLTHDHVFGLLGRPRDRGDVEIVGVFEPNADLAARRAAEFQLGPELLFEDLEAMLVATRPDAVCLFGSTREHRDDAIACFAHGAHVMVEKPLAVSSDDATAMADAARRAARHLLTNYETTWYPSVGALGRRLEAGEQGPVRRLVVRSGHPGPIEIGCRPEFLAWLLDPHENGGGALTDFGCYGVNLSTWLAAGRRPHAVTATAATRKPALYPRVDDDATLLLEYPDRIAVVQASWNWPHNVKDLCVSCERGDLLTVGADRLRSHTAGGEPSTKRAPSPAAADGDPFAHLAAVVRGDAEPNELSSLANNLVVVEVLDAARESARTGRTVRLDAPSR